MMAVSLENIEAARGRLAGAIYHSPAPYSLSLSRLCGCEVFCKLEHLQMTGSFKERGARNKLLTMGEADRKRGVVAASAGNHALGLAYHGQLLGVPVRVVMPLGAPLVKVSNTRGFGAEVILFGESYDEARGHAMRLAEREGLTYVQGFDDEAIIAGTGTIGLEILEDVPGVEAVVVPVGGGGLIAGVGTAIKAVRPEVKIIGVEPVHAATLAKSLEKGRATYSATTPTLADGLAVAQVGELCWELTRKCLDQLVLVEETEIARAILRLLELEKMVVEGAGAAPLAGLMGGKMGLAGKKVVLLLSGGNIDVTLLARIIERGMAADGRLTRIVVHISDRPGSLAKLLTVIAQTGASIKEVAQDRNFGPADMGRVDAACILETRDWGHVKEIHGALKEAGLEVVERG